MSFSVKAFLISFLCFALTINEFWLMASVVTGVWAALERFLGKRS